MKSEHEARPCQLDAWAAGCDQIIGYAPMVYGQQAYLLIYVRYNTLLKFKVTKHACKCLILFIHTLTNIQQLVSALFDLDLENANIYIHNQIFLSEVFVEAHKLQDQTLYIACVAS